MHEAPQPAPPLPPPPPPPPGEVRRPARIDPVPGTPYGLAIFAPPRTVAGPAVGSLLAGVGALLVALLVGCAGLVDVAAVADGQPAGVGLLVGSAFGVLAGFLGVAGLGLGIVGIRRTRRPAAGDGSTVSGRGMALAGLICGSAGLAVVVCSLALAAILAAA